jgi:hypothetical protein
MEKQIITGSIIICDHCNYDININKHGYHILERVLNNIVEEEVWCYECYYSTDYKGKKAEGWGCIDDEDENKK